MPSSNHEELVGQIEHITYTNSDNGFTIAQVRVPNRPEPITIVGTILSPTPGEILRMRGEWSRHPKYGRQFKVADYSTSVPATTEGILKYLGSGMIKGLGPVMARRIVEKFGKSTLDIIEKDIDKLGDVEGIGRKRIKMIRAAWDEQKDIREVMIFLQSHGVGTGHATKIFKRYGMRSVAVVKDNPFRLASDIVGIGFTTADRIARNLGLPPESDARVSAGILYVLNQFADEGHVYAPREELIRKCREVLGVEEGIVESALKRLALEGKIVFDGSEESAEGQNGGQAVYLTQFHLCETFIAERLRSLISAPKSIREIDLDPALQWVQQRLSIRLADKQKEAVKAALKRKVLVVTGGPGTGKTTIINAILNILQRLNVEIELAAPTGRAAKRMSETCGRPARTIHRLLEFNMINGGFQRDERNPLQCRLLVIDEASMLDTVLMYYLLKAVPLYATLILVGDVHQLPSVGPGSILRDIIESETAPVVELSEIFRQARQSRIVVNAHRINRGELPDLGSATDANLTDFYFIQQEDPDKILEIVLELVKERIPRRFGIDPLDDIQVLTPMYRGVIGAGNLNSRLQETLNPGRDAISIGDRGFRVNDKVMQIRNNYETSPPIWTKSFWPMPLRFTRPRVPSTRLW